MTLWFIGLSIETVADLQKFHYKERHRDRWCDIGLFRYSRHPNYFGEIILWWGIFLSCASMLQGWIWMSIIAPIFHTFSILFVTGIPLLERHNNEKFGSDPNYIRYKENTSILIPSIPKEIIKEKLQQAERSYKNE